MTDQPSGETRDIAADGTQENAEAATPGGGGTRGPALAIGGEQEPSGEVPPYEGRPQDVPVKTDGSDYRDGARVGGATGPVESTGDRASPDPAGTLRGATGSPADEQPAAEQPQVTDGDDPRDDSGVGPAHVEGTARGEDHAD